MTNLTAVRNYTFEIVGSYYRPPAQIVLNNLSSAPEARLWLTPEYSNPHDSNAIAVWLEVNQIPANILNRILDLCQKQNMLTEPLNDDFIQLGYVSRQEAALLRCEEGELVDSIPGEYYISPVTNKYFVKFSLPAEGGGGVSY
jgi:hypothetical protein